MEAEITQLPGFADSKPVTCHMKDVITGRLELPVEVIGGRMGSLCGLSSALFINSLTH